MTQVSPPSHIDPAVNATFDPGTPARRWILADGRGGYASLPLDACPRSRFDGWLVWCDPRTLRRKLLLARLDDVVHDRFGASPLSAARYLGAQLEPHGAPRWDIEPRAVTSTHALGDAIWTRSARLEPDRLVVTWRHVEGSDPATLVIRPLLAFRDYDRLTSQNDEASFRTAHATVHDRTLRPYAALPALRFTFHGATWRDTRDWYRDVQLPEDEERGDPAHEDLLSPGVITTNLVPGDAFTLVVEVLPDPPVHTTAVVPLTAPDDRAAPGEDAPPSALRTLHAFADTFLYRRPDGSPGILAGFPWFLEWGRDTHIALPGLLVARDRLDDATRCLLGTVRRMRGGLVPNMWGGTDADTSWNSADATLWFALAVRRTADRLADPAPFRDATRPALLAAFDTLRAPNPSGLALADDGLLHLDAAHAAGTWMDAVVDGRPVTPRDGAPIELQALWLDLLANLRADEDALSATHRDAVRDALARAEDAFLPAFRVAGAAWLADVARAGGQDTALRPNALVAAALPAVPLSVDERRGVVDAAWHALATDAGLRTLAPDHPDFRPRYAGDRRTRDRAYHQGTVWPWLAGFLVEAAARARPDDADARADCARWLDSLLNRVGEVAIGGVCEIHDGDPPHAPRGAWTQAWSVGEWIRASVCLHEWRP